LRFGQQRVVPYCKLRGDLREEFLMAEEAFALSPISARAALPSEEDYAAISEAFMETSRGRWFLGEYAKRNRNADTRMVLDAVARIEESIASQKQAASDTKLTEALAAIRQAVVKTQTAAGAALDAMALEQHLAPIHKGVRVIREISWRLREVGADGRICDIIDSQATAIETSTEQISSAKARSTVDAAFADLLEQFVEYEATGGSQAKAPDEEPRVVPFPGHMEAAPVTEETIEPEPPEQVAEARAETVAFFEDPAFETEMPVAEPVEITDAAAEAHDEAMLDLIAAEMSAPDPFAESFEIAAEAAPIAEPALDVVAESPAPVVAAIEPEIQIPRPVIEPSPEPVASAAAHEGSLGSSIIASGMLRKPNTPANDPLAPIRRMSQAERIAFFS
jgi:hypothetical protein